MPQNYIGCDISKDRLDVFDPRSGNSAHANTASGIRALIRACGPDNVLVFEGEAITASGSRGWPNAGCDRALLKAVAAAGKPIVRLNPLHAWHFAQSLNLPKTDKTDARMLARLGSERQPAPQLPQDPARAELAELADRRDQLKRMETQEKNRVTNTTSPMIRADIRASLKALAARIAQFEAEIADHLARHPDLARDAALLRSTPGVGAGVGAVTAATLLARLPKLGHLDRRAVASLAGLAPKARESGKFRGQRRIGQGRDVVRRLMYMVALSLWRTPGPTTAAMRRMQEAGKPAKVILFAMARKIVAIANAVLKDQTHFRTAQT